MRLGNLNDEPVECFEFGEGMPRIIHLALVDANVAELGGGARGVVHKFRLGFFEDFESEAFGDCGWLVELDAEEVEQLLRSGLSGMLFLSELLNLVDSGKAECYEDLASVWFESVKARCEKSLLGAQVPEASSSSHPRL